MSIKRSCAVLLLWSCCTVTPGCGLGFGVDLPSAESSDDGDSPPRPPGIEDPNNGPTGGEPVSTQTTGGQLGSGGLAPVCEPMGGAGGEAPCADDPDDASER